MQSPFGAKLFRLFLAFALVPAVLLVAAGYYLAIGTTALLPGEKASCAQELSDYYADLLFAELEGSLQSVEDSNEPVAGAANYGFVWSIPDSRIAQEYSPMAPDAARQIVAVAATRPMGFVEHDGRFYQYACRLLTDSSLLCIGLLHDSSYAALLTAVQSEQAVSGSSRDLLNRYLLFLLLVLSALILLTIVLAYVFSSRLSRNLSRPLLELSSASQKIAEGDFGQQVTPSGTGEIASLIENFNRMAQQLDATTRRLAQSERVAAWRHVARRFAHELKNPLQPILISLYQIQQSLAEPQNNARLREALRAASEEIEHLKALADRFSQLAKLPPPRTERINLNELLASLGQLYREQLAAYDFELDLPHQAVFVQADPTYFREALHNVLLNAMEASRTGGRIELALEADEKTARITVTDHGCGMSPETSAAATMPYFTTGKAGSGLGLAIVEKTVTEVGGRLHIESEEGHGTSVSIILPRSQ
ncbi:MAG: ATP-binding protein [Candidatus Zixiibacteriota bacterium]